MGDYALGGDDALATLSVSPANSSFFVEGGGLYHTDSSSQALVRFAPATPASAATVAPGTATIGAGAFENSARLERVTLPDGLITIDDDAFSGCDKLTDMPIPDTVQVARGLVGTGLDTIDMARRCANCRWSPTASASRATSSFVAVSTVPSIPPARTRGIARLARSSATG